MNSSQKHSHKEKQIPGGKDKGNSSYFTQREQ